MSNVGVRARLSVDGSLNVQGVAVETSLALVRSSDIATPDLKSFIKGPTLSFRTLTNDLIT